MSEEDPSQDTQDTDEAILRAAATAGNTVVGDQTVAYAGVQIQIEDAAHQRWVEQKRLEHQLQEAAIDNKWRRIRENITFGVVVLVVFCVFIGTVYVALTTSDPARQTFAQSLALTIFGTVGGAFAGYMVGEHRK